MKSYESLIILQPTLSDEDQTKLIESIEGWITANEGEILLSKPWGIRELASPISRYNQGFYVQIQFNATRKTLEELRSKIRVTETIIRDLTVTMDSIVSKRQPEAAVALPE
ncbi:30S ribosomal protein S6 [bacterium]|nr:30S ribosomal protein S6 [bacterium]